MHIKSFFATMPLLLASTARFATACSPSAFTNNTGGPPISWGCDDPADSATTGYFSNHFSLNSKDLEKTLDFYSRVFGFRHIFTVQASEHLSIAYMGHSQGGRNGTGYQKTAELARDQRNAGGLMEVIYLDVPDKSHLQASSQRASTFGHIGIIVPDVEAAQARLETFPDVRILKQVGGPTVPGTEIAFANGFPPEAWVQLSAEEQTAVENVLTAINDRFIYVADPDGNIIEIQQQD